MTDEPHESSQIAVRPDDANEGSALVPAQPGAVGPLIQGKAEPGSPRMSDPEGKVRSGQYRSDSKLARHPSHRPFEKD